jgi:hypothetical protein
LFPNTAYVKAGGTPPPGYAARLHAHGLYYIWQWAWQSKAVLTVPFAAIAAWRFPRFVSLALVIIAVYLVYTWRVGGDFMGLHRFVLPLFPLTAILCTLGLGWLVERLPARALAPGAAAAAAILVGLFLFTQLHLDRVSRQPVADNGIDRPGYLKLYAEDRAAIGKVLAPLIRPDELSWVGGVGVQPYYGRMRAYDVFGLVSRQVAHDVPPTNPRPGHQKWAPTAMVLATHPTFIFYVYALHGDPAHFAYNSPGEASVFHAHGYEDCTLHVPGLREHGEYYTFLKLKTRDFPCLERRP